MKARGCYALRCYISNDINDIDLLTMTFILKMPVAVLDSVATGVIRVSQTHILPLYITIQLLVYSRAESPETNPMSVIVFITYCDGYLVSMSARRNKIVY